MATEAIVFKDVCKKFNKAGYYAVDHVSFTVNEGEFITILGSSGCGKTTLLKMVNRLYEPDSGRIILFGEDISTVDPVTVRRRIGYVIQDIGLFPHMTIADNVASVPKLLKWDKNETDVRVDELLEMVGLEPAEFRKRFPSQLSGGQQQRVGLARALATSPKIMLMDEPFGAVDAITRTSLQDELLRLHGDLKKTFLFVTHDINEAFKMGGRTIIMNHGSICQFDTPKEVIKNPADDFVHSLVQSAIDQEKFWNGVEIGE
jgi:osmoprotectant transport system ATP-binding protein